MPVDLNNAEDQMILGSQLANPYTVSNMQLAYNLLYTTPGIITANFLYVKFRPTNTDQLSVLEDDNDIELQDHPMDYEVIQDGDYYQDPTVNVEQIPWLYSVVPVGFVPPTGIQYQIISNLHIPNNNLDVESMAESLVSGASYQVTYVKGVPYVYRTDVTGIEPILQLPVPCYSTEEDPCNGGGGGIAPQPNVDPKIPRGILSVNNQLDCSVLINNVPLMQVRVVCKRWFKIWRGYTNNTGNFLCDRKFKNRVKIIVKTKNSFAKIAKVRGVRLWQMVFPVKKRIGVFDQGAVANINYIFIKPANADATNKDLPYWVAATQHNSVIEFRNYSTETNGFNLPVPPSGLKIMITNWGESRGTGSAPMFAKCGVTTVGSQWLSFFLSVPAFMPVGYGPLGIIVRKNVDLSLSYLPIARLDYNCGLTSAALKNIAFHELGHAQHYGQAGCTFWGAYRGAIITELSKLNQLNLQPYGSGNDATTAPIIATGEMWGNHCEFIYSNRHWARTVPQARIQGVDFINAIGGLNCYLNAIENFNPNAAADIWRWIPQGLPYDLGDDANDNINTVNRPIDNVFGYTNLQSFNALGSDILSIAAFRNRFILLNGNAQLTQVNQLFTQYGY